MTLGDDMLTGEQWAQRTRRHCSPTETLWLAVLTEAICLAAGAGAQSARWHRGRATDEAIEWIMSEAIAIGSFRWTCDVLHLDADWIRRELRHTEKTRMRKLVQYIHSAGSVGKKAVA